MRTALGLPLSQYGVERPAVIVTDLSESTRDALRYVAMTRARSVLMMVGEETGLKRATNV